MDIDISIDFDSERIKMTIDNSTTLVVSKLASGMGYKGFTALESDILGDKLKKIADILFTIIDDEEA